MGEWKVQVPVKFDNSVVERLDSDVQRFAPFCDGRSAIVRVLVEFAYAAIDSGMVTWDLPSIQKVLSNSRRQGVPGVPEVPGLRKVAGKR